MELIKGNCLEEMKNISDKSIDMILIDPPYNISRKTNFHTMHGHRGTSMDYGEWDKGFDIIGYISSFPRILKDGANLVIFSAWKNCGDIAKEMEKNGIIPKRCLVLNKSNPAPFNRERLFVNDVEFAVWGVYKKKWTFNRQSNKYERCIINTKVQTKKLHPTMKDLNVIEHLIKVLSNEGDVILDCFMGSGTTGVACKNLNRDFIGIELDEKYFNIAKQRIDDA